MSITRQIERSKDRIARRFKTKLLMAYFQSFTNTYAPVTQLKALYDEALAVENVVAGHRHPARLRGRGSVGPAGILCPNHLIWVEYGLQSAHDHTLSLINRGHDFACFERAVSATRNRNINICAHVILGLPGETRQDMMATADAVAAMVSTASNCTCFMWCGGPPWKPCTERAATDAWSSGSMPNCLQLHRTAPETTIIQRLTGDPHLQELVAPAWSLQKKDTLT